MTAAKHLTEKPAPPHGKLAGAWLLVAAATGGAVIMAVELLGARMLSVGYGGSLTVWSAMISVTLLSLAAGYYVGGHLSDRRPRPAVLYAIMIAGAALVAACPHAGFVLRACYGRLGLQGGALASSAILFFLPLGILGMTSPFVIRLLSEVRKGVGATAGNVYAISTIGSVAGTLLTGLWLIPNFGTATGFTIAAAALAAAAAVGFLIRFGWRGAPALLVPVALALVPRPALAVGQTYTAPDGDKVTVVDVADSAYGRITVLEKGQYNLLAVDGIVQTGVPRDLPRLQKGQLLATNYFQELIPYMVDDPASASVLIVGLAGGMTATLLRQYDMDVDAVDLDPRIIEVARRHFFFTGPATAADGRRFLEDCRKRYDFCVIDTYSGDVFPFHLASIEAFRAAKAVLKDGGALVINFIGSPRGLALACVCKTLAGAFGHVLAIKGERSDDVQTVTLFASDRPIEFNSGWLRYAGGFRGVDPVADAIARLSITPDRPDAFVLTDDYNPIDFIRMDEAIRWRQRTAEFVGPQVAFQLR